MKKNAIVTGAAGQLGSLLCMQLNKLGWRLALVGRDETRLNALSKSLSDNSTGGEHVAFAMDLGQPGAGKEVAGQVLKQMGPVHALFHLACPKVKNENGLGLREDRELMLTVNAGSFLEIVEQLLPVMLRQQNGLIVGMLSEAITSPVVKSWPSYVIAKGALKAALSIVSEYCRGTGVKAIGLAPGALDLPDTPVPAGLVAEKQIRLPADLFLSRMMESIDGPKSLSNGFCRLISANRDEISLLADLSQVETHVPQKTITVHEPASSSKGQQHREQQATLERAFRKTFRLADDFNVRNASVHTIGLWDSLGHLRLVMEVEKALGISIDGKTAANLKSYINFEEHLGIASADK